MEIPQGQPADTGTLLELARRHAGAHADPSGVARTPVPGLVAIRASAPSGLDHAISRPLACLVLQGSKRVAMGARSFDFSAGDSLLITADVPTVSQITRASAAAPYYSVVLDLDLALIAELALEMQPVAGAAAAPVRVEQTDADVADAMLRLFRLIERPAALPILQDQLLREIHYWLLSGRHGPAIRQLGRADGTALRLSRAIALLRAEFSQPLPVARLAAAAGMSPSSFHQHFRSATSLSPLQFQKQLRLIEARRLMTAGGLSASSAAFGVGYESVQQFTREYRRMFGAPPGRDAQSLRRSAGVPG